MLGGGVQRRGANQAREALGKLACVPFRKRLAEIFTDDQAEYAITQELETLIVRAVRQLAIGTVRDRAVEQLGGGEVMAENSLQVAAFAVVQIIQMIRVIQAVTRFYFEGAGFAAACFLASSACCLQRACKPPGIAAHFV
jgi:hypothetical protein